MGRKPKNELSGLARAARDQLKRAEALGKSLDARMKIKKDASEVWVPNEDDRRDFAAITSTLQHAGNAMRGALDSNKKNLGGLTEEQLMAQFNAELVAAAPQLTDEQWAKMCEARAKAGKL